MLAEYLMDDVLDGVLGVSLVLQAEELLSVVAEEDAHLYL